MHGDGARRAAHGHRDRLHRPQRAQRGDQRRHQRERPDQGGDHAEAHGVRRVRHERGRDHADERLRRAQQALGVTPHQGPDADAPAAHRPDVAAVDGLPLDQDVAGEPEVEGEHRALHAADQGAARGEAGAADALRKREGKQQ